MKVTSLPSIPVQSIEPATLKTLIKYYGFKPDFWEIVTTVAASRGALNRVLLVKNFDDITTSFNTVLSRFRELGWSVEEKRGGMKRKTVTFFLPSISKTYPGLLKNPLDYENQLLFNPMFGHYMDFFENLPYARTKFSTVTSQILVALKKTNSLAGVGTARSAQIGQNRLTGKAMVGAFKTSNEKDAALLSPLLIGYLECARLVAMLLLFQMDFKDQKITDQTLTGRDFKIVPNIISFYRHSTTVDLGLNLPTEATEFLLALAPAVIAALGLSAEDSRRLGLY